MALISFMFWEAKAKEEIPFCGQWTPEQAL